MYQEFYGLRDIPFSLASDPKYLFRTSSLLEVFANLQYGIENGKGLVVVTGEVGTGKTTMLRSMLQSLDETVLAAYIFNPILSTEEFFDLAAGEFRLQPQSSKAAMLRQLGHALMSRHAQGMRTVLVIDEAHLLPAHLLEEIRLLSNFETNRDKLLQIILCGQPELHELLSRPELRHLKQRVSLKCSIKPLTDHETAEYIRWRLCVAGAKDENLFEPEAIEMIHRFSGGIPRIINNISDNSLLTGFGEGSRRITRSIVRDVIGELDLMPMEAASTSFAAAAPSRVFDRERFLARPTWQQSDDRSQGLKQQPSDNVRYIRPRPSESPAPGPDSGNGRRVISERDSQNGRDGNESAKFFLRVRVSKKA
ncbi:MAG: AAA family ATPase [Blastocatellia bacterium]|nr:AAA family ATPase [Blastocatellia bacterium]